MIESILSDTLSIATMIIYVVYVAVIVIIIRRFVQPFAYKTLLAMATISVLILLLSRAQWTGDPDWTNFWIWFRHMSGEFNLQATFAAGQLLAVGVAALAISWWGASLRLWIRLYWVMVALVFIGMAADEYYMLHEGRNWVPFYATIGVILLIFSALVFWHGLKRQMLVVFILMFGGLGVMAVGGVVLEYEAASGCRHLPSWLDICDQLPFIEEALEKVGAGLALAGVLTFAQKSVDVTLWPRARRRVIGFSLGGVIILLTSFWIVPQLEARLLAERVNVRYLDGQIALIGYRAPERAFRPGESVPVAFYWRAEAWIPVDFHLSAQLLTLPDAGFAAEQRLINSDPPAVSWVPGFVRRLGVTLTIPDDLDVPASLVISAPIWFTDAQSDAEDAEFVSIPVYDSSQTVFGEYLPDLTRIAVLPETVPPSPPTEADIRFASPIALVGFALPDEVVDTLDVAFWWQADGSPDRDMVQVFHLFEVDGEGIFILDQDPFDGRFPTGDWVRGMRVMDEWTLSLPEDMPAGEYRVITGLYDQNSLDREAIITGGGLPVQDNLVELGIIRKSE